MAVELLTYDDCIQHLVDVFQFTDATGLGRLARRAVDTVYRDIPYRTNWKYYQRRRTFESVASYSTGTIEYDHTGGSSERLITLTSGTFPSWAAYGKIIIDEVHYRIATNPSTTTLTLYEEDNPGEDVAAGETYTLYRSQYPLPADFRRPMRIYDVQDEQEIPLVDWTEIQRLSTGIDDTPDWPRRACIRNTGDFYGVWSIEFSPAPSTVRPYDISYEAKPRDINTVSYATGTISTSSTTVTGSGTVFPTLCAGSVIRFGTSGSSTAVTNKFGSNPFTEQRVIVSRGGDTSLTVDQAPTSAYASSTAYQISDPVDIQPGGMTTAFLRAIEAEFAKMRNLKDAPERLALANGTLMRAIEAEPSNMYANEFPQYPPRIRWTTE